MKGLRNNWLFKKGLPVSGFVLFGILVCGATGVTGNSTLVDTPLVTLSAQGNANFRGSLGTLPAACTSQPNVAFLIRTGGGAWLASGMVRVTETDNDYRR